MFTRQAITCKYLSPTNSKGSRVKASCARGSVTIAYPDRCSNFGEAAALAARSLQAKFIFEDTQGEEKTRTLPDNNPWGGELFAGSCKSGEIVFVFASCKLDKISPALVFESLTLENQIKFTSAVC